MKNISKADLLKGEILRQYKSIRQFAIEMDIPYSTMITALDRGIDGMAYGTVIRICERLNINPVTFKPLTDETVSEQILENQVMYLYLKLNQKGKNKILELMDDFASLKKYKAKQ